MSVSEVCIKEWVIMCMAMIRCISEQLWGITCNKHYCEAFIQLKLECAASNGNRYPPYTQVMATAISQ